jgi:hypothetical protein
VDGRDKPGQGEKLAEILKTLEAVFAKGNEAALPRKNGRRWSNPDYPGGLAACRKPGRTGSICSNGTRVCGDASRI